MASNRLCLHEGHIDQVLAQEPDLQFIAPQYLAYHQIVGSIIAQLVAAACQITAGANDDLMCIQQAGELNWYFFSTSRRAWNFRGFLPVRCPCPADYAKA